MQHLLIKIYPFCLAQLILRSLPFIGCESLLRVVRVVIVFAVYYRGAGNHGVRPGLPLA
jgi:hypothetical protein